MAPTARICAAEKVPEHRSFPLGWAAYAGWHSRMVEPLASCELAGGRQGGQLLTGSLRPGCSGSEAAALLLYEDDSSRCFHLQGTLEPPHCSIRSWDTGFLLHGAWYLDSPQGLSFRRLRLSAPPLPDTASFRANSSTQSRKQGVWATYCTFSCTFSHVVGRLGLAHTLCRVRDLTGPCCCSPGVPHKSSSFLTCSPPPC